MLEFWGGEGALPPQNSRVPLAPLTRATYELVYDRATATRRPTDGREKTTKHRAARVTFFDPRARAANSLPPSGRVNPARTRRARKAAQAHGEREKAKTDAPKTVPPPQKKL